MEVCLDFEECTQDSPVFRLTLELAEQEVSHLESQVEKVMKLCSKMVEAGKSYTAANQLFLSGLTEFSTFHGKDSSVANCVNHLNQALQETLNFHTMLFDQTQRAVNQQLTSLFTQFLPQLGEIRREFVRIGEDLEAAALKSAQVSRLKSPDAERASHLLLATRKCYQHFALDYCLQLNNFKIQQKVDILNSVFSYYHAQYTFFHQGFDLLKDLEPTMKTMATQLSQLSAECGVQRKDLENRHLLVQQRIGDRDCVLDVKDEPSEATCSDPQGREQNTCQQTGQADALWDVKDEPSEATCSDPQGGEQNTCQQLRSLKDATAVCHPMASSSDDEADGLDIAEEPVLTRSATDLEIGDRDCVLDVKDEPSEATCSDPQGREQNTCQQIHPSIIKTGSQLESTTYQNSHMGCPLCPKFNTTRGMTIWRHLDAHIRNAVHFQDTIICRCNLSCRDSGHYHCPYCAKTITRKEVMTLHVTGCQGTCDTVPGPCEPSSLVLPSSVPPSAELSPSVPSSSSLCASQEIPAHPHTLPKPHSEPRPPLSALEDSIASVVSVDHSYTLPPSSSGVGVDLSYTASPPEPSNSHAFPPEEAANAAAQSETTDLPSSRVTFLKWVKCPHCSVVLYKDNLLVHIQRKHARPKDITAASHLNSVCVDETRGLFAIPKSSHGLPIHVQRKTWGKLHVTKCELEDCRQYQSLAQRSGLGHSLCEHIRSLDYCTKTATEEPLKHEVLEEMSEFKFFAKSKVAACKKRQKAAEKAHAPLSVLVEVGGSQNQICLSVHEPKIYQFCCFGRVMVTYNRKKNTWHCPCAMAHTSCRHKNIAKWHLFQTRKELFMTAPGTTETFAETKN